MESVDSSAVTATAGRKRLVNKKKRGWHKRLHARKTAAQPHAMQSEDKHGPKKIAEGWEQFTALQPSSEKPSQGAQQSWHRTDDGLNTLRFTCSQCWDSLEYVPKDLVKHYEEKHKGIPPVFSCHVCTFSTHEFSYLQVHLLSHKDTLSSCSVCNDNVQRTWPEFSAHLMMHHCQNDIYSCELCQTFSTGDVGVFLEHVYAHNSGLEAAHEDLLLHTKDRSKFWPKMTTQTLRCQHCGYETSQKLLINKHIKAVHPHGKQRTKKMEETKSIAMKLDDPNQKIKTRLTRSAVRQMCWLAEDCLSLPGRDFLDKYCHLSDPQTTLDETQQFLMKSVAAETGDQKWTKALKTVLSNVPQDLNHLPKTDNSIKSNPLDLTVLTVKNKMSIAQNGSTYGKKLRTTTSSEKETFSHESAANDSCHVVDQNGCPSNLNDHTTCPQTETKLDNQLIIRHVLCPAQNEPSERSQTQDNRENQELRSDQEMEEPMHEDGIELSSELKLAKECEEQTTIHQVLPKKKRPNRRRKTRSKKGNTRSAGLPLKIVLKKNPVKEKQWVSQSSLSPSGGGLTSPHVTAEEMAHILQDMLLPEAPQKKWTKASKADLQDPPQAITSIPQLKPGDPTPSCVPVGPNTVDRNMPVSLPTPHRGMQGDAGKPLLLSETGVCLNSSAGRNSSAADETGVEVFPENNQLQTSDGGMDCHSSDSEMTTSPDAHTIITPENERHSADINLVGAEGISRRDVPAASRPDLLSSPAVKAVQQDPSTPSGHQWQPSPKSLERTLKLVAINPHQLVKCPAGNQPVVVLNHPDADIPEVARIMEVVNRYRGEVQKVLLSRRTASAVSAMNNEVSMTNEPTDAQLDSMGRGKNCVQERFMLKLKLRRLSRKKYEVVETVSPSRDAATRFRCWFCGRVFTSQETWIVHRQRHLMEWK